MMCGEWQGKHNIGRWRHLILIWLHLNITNKLIKVNGINSMAIHYRFPKMYCSLSPREVNCEAISRSCVHVYTSMWAGQSHGLSAIALRMCLCMYMHMHMCMYMCMSMCMWMASGPKNWVWNLASMKLLILVWLSNICSGVGISR